ncbi:MAG: hypothetical protein ACOCVF_00650 [bacterium]
MEKQKMFLNKPEISQIGSEYLSFIDFKDNKIKDLILKILLKFNFSYLRNEEHPDPNFTGLELLDSSLLYEKKNVFYQHDIINIINGIILLYDENEKKKDKLDDEKFSDFFLNKKNEFLRKILEGELPNPNSKLTEYNLYEYDIVLSCDKLKINEFIIELLNNNVDTYTTDEDERRIDNIDNAISEFLNNSNPLSFLYNKNLVKKELLDRKENQSLKIRFNEILKHKYITLYEDLIEKWSLTPKPNKRKESDDKESNLWTLSTEENSKKKKEYDEYRVIYLTAKNLEIISKLIEIYEIKNAKDFKNRFFCYSLVINLVEELKENFNPEIFFNVYQEIKPSTNKDEFKLSFFNEFIRYIKPLSIQEQFKDEMKKYYNT